MTDVTEILQLFQNAIATFAERVSQVRVQYYSKTVASCHHYILKHLYQELTLSHLAKEVNINPSYLSFLFKKEVGIPVSTFIQQEKIEEAKNLLTLTDYSITEIYTSLNFTDQSYFTKVFKRFTGITPLEYRNRNTLS
ncbi:helix-turn-helix domain-containing protein [Bacillus timonensis]|uniref:helix-turn-helix domain-containing protein n=1 Tax=Bacillus timonensis TaxID=1033734 RepID=UPI00031AA8CB|nr:AraC family transcriptional regulator [Bacillus timonensis]